MRPTDPQYALSHALDVARLYHLPAVPWSYKGEDDFKRPHPDEIDVRLFLQSWPDSALGFDLDEGPACQAFTRAPTVVVLHGRAACVYFGQRLAYRVTRTNRDFLEDMRSATMVSQSEAGARYGAEMPALVEAEIR